MPNRGLRSGRLRLRLKILTPLSWPIRKLLNSHHRITPAKQLKYPKGRSRIVYVGKTHDGIERIAKSAAYRAPSVLKIPGVTEFSVKVLVPKLRQRVDTAYKLERALLIKFCEKYGTPPYCNKTGQRMRQRDEFSNENFRSSRVDDILHYFG